MGKKWERWSNLFIRDILNYMKHFLHHLFLPHHTNNHRPKVLHNHSLFFVIAALIIFSITINTVQKDHPAVLGISSNISIQELLTITNQKREEKGLSPLVLSPELSQAAAQKANHMFAHNYWAHVAPDGTTPWVFIKNSGYEYLYAGENLARGFTTSPDVVEAWMESPTHRENMLSPNYTDIGFAVSSGSLTGAETVLVVEMFGKKYISTNQPAVPSTPPVAETLPTQEPQSGMQPQSGFAVASIQNSPLFDSKSITRTVSLALLLLFIVVLIVDAIVIERKKIARVVSHNVDHILFLTILLLAAIIIGKGMIL